MLDPDVLAAGRRLLKTMLPVALIGAKNDALQGEATSAVAKGSFWKTLSFFTGNHAYETVEKLGVDHGPW